MFIIKKKYYLYIENTQDIDFEKIRRSNKFIIIYRNNKGQECKKKIIEFKKKCSKKNFLFFVSNDSKLAIDCKADGLYLSSYNKSKVYNQNKNVIGSAHNYKEIYEK